MLVSTSNVFIPVKQRVENIQNTDKLKEACTAFEALFIAELLRAMEKTIPQDPLIKDNAANSIYKFMYINALSQKISETSPFSIAKTLFNSLKKYLTYKTHIHPKMHNKPIKLDTEIKFKPLNKDKFKSLPKNKNKMLLIKEAVEEASKKYNLPKKLIMSVIKVESSFNPYAVSKTGAVGLMQLMPQTAAELGVKNVWDIRQNIMGGAKYLAKLLKEFKDYKKALAAYNAGPANVKKYNGIPPFRETQNYVKKVLAYVDAKY